MRVPKPNQWNTDRIDAIVLPALERLLHDGELDSLSIESEQSNLRMLWARISVRGEQIQILVSDDDVAESLDQAKQRFFDELQSEISESSFAWGQLRE
ncbi:hypothetical protein ABH903_003355 [Brevibacterium epidermidis]|jgi:hypothetical protein|uniref:DUF2218 domain-containing protein n=1 Tax=Brevibacterium epidermidis TaxID=1698 RepID=A0ABV4EP83_BREEP